MGTSSCPPSPTLPGAWCSTWTLSSNHFKADDQKTARAPSGNSTRTEDNYHPALLESANFRECDLVWYTRSIVHDDQASACGSFDRESTQSDDFYSVVSHQDGDTILLSEMISISPKGQDNSEDFPSYVVPNPRNCSARLSSRLSLHLQEDITFADDASSKVSVGSYSAHAPAKKAHLALDMDNISSKSSLVSRISQKSSSSAKSSSSRSASLRQNGPRRDSVHSNYSGLNYAGVCNLIDQLDAGNTSEASFPRPQTPSRFNSPRQIHRRRIDHVNSANALELSQPDADDPWTLSLDPALTSTESTSISSTSSLSLGSSNASQDGENPEIPFPSPISSPQFQSLPRQPPTTHDTNEIHDIDVCTTRHGSNDSIYAPPVEQPFPLSGSIPPFASCLHEEPPKQSKNVIKKTKELCSKFKRFIVSKTSKQPVPKPMISDPPTSPGFDRMDYNMGIPPPIQYHRSPSSSTTSWSYHRRGVGVFQRSAKMSTPSVALSSRTEIASKNQSRAPSVNEKYSYEYHARPKTLEEIRRSKRRFSLPTFTGPAAGSSTSTAKNLDMFSRPHRRKREGSILSAR